MQTTNVPAAVLAAPVDQGLPTWFDPLLLVCLGLALVGLTVLVGRRQVGKWAAILTVVAVVLSVCGLVVFDGTNHPFDGANNAWRVHEATRKMFFPVTLSFGAVLASAWILFERDARPPQTRAERFWFVIVSVLVFLLGVALGWGFMSDLLHAME